MTSIDYNDRLYRTYHEARELLPCTARLWMDVIRGYLGAKSGLTALDLGSGTGRFSVVLADALDAYVIGVEPSDKMRAVAESKSRHPKVRYVKGTAERIPVTDERCGFGWLSMVIHHVSDLDAAARELRRVLRPNGLAFIRNSFRDRLDSVRFYEFFPSAFAADNARLPSVETVRDAFERNGFRFVAFQAVEQVIDSSLAQHVARLRRRGLSTFELIPGEEFGRGIELMEQAARKEDPHKPVTEMIDLLVLCRPAERPYLAEGPFRLERKGAGD